MGNTELHRDEQLSRALYGKHADALLSYVRRLLHGDRQLAEDIAQEAMLRVWKHADQRPSDAQRLWVFTVDCYYRGNTAAQIAAARNLPPGAVRCRIHYALQAPGLALTERGVSGS